MRAVDQADSADYSLTDVLEPSGWTLLNFLMDSRTGLGRFRDFRISNYQLMMELIDEVLQQDSVETILATPGRRGARRPLPRSVETVRGPAQAGLLNGGRPGRRRPAVRGHHLRR